jgi:hypothetical protein
MVSGSTQGIFGVRIPGEESDVERYARRQRVIIIIIIFFFFFFVGGQLVKFSMRRVIGRLAVAWPLLSADAPSQSH